MNYKLLILLLLTSCITSNKGKILDNDDIERLNVDLTSKDNVIRTIGFPSFVSDFDNNRWVYYSYKIKKFLFFKPDLEDQRVLVLDFEDNILKKLSLYNIDTNGYEPLENSITTSIENDTGVIEDIFGNIGQIK
ncbi:MAG: outer membrane protein assembly factor BamE, partial [Rickettsiales bacterium]|nr:outer membrane protein assembly factor BamE [Rickettsiales bacterium]